MKGYLVGHDPARLEEMRFKIANPDGLSLQQPHPGPRRAGVRVPRPARTGASACRSTISSAASCRTRCRSRPTSSSATRTPTDRARCGPPTQLVEQAEALKKNHGFTSHKLKGGVFHPDYELECCRARRRRRGRDRVRFDPNGGLVDGAGHPLRPGASRTSTTTTSRTPSSASTRCAAPARRCGCRSRPTPWSWASSSSPRTCSTPRCDVILLDTTFWGGIRPCVKAAGVCETRSGLGVAVHSSGELGDAARDDAAPRRRHAQPLASPPTRTITTCATT